MSQPSVSPNVKTIPTPDRERAMPSPDSLIGIGLYTPSEAERLTGVRAGKIIRCSTGTTFEIGITSRSGVPKGLTAQQHQALLGIKGFVRPGPATVGDVPQFLLIRHIRRGSEADIAHVPRA